MQRGNILTFLLVGILVLIGVIGGLYLQSKTISKPSSNPEKLIYCIGHSGVVSQILYKDGKISTPDRSGFLSSSAYDYHCYKFDIGTNKTSEISITEINNSKLSSEKKSIEGWEINSEKANGDLSNRGGLFVSKVYLINGNKRIFLEDETTPTKVFKFIGWIN